MQLDFMINHRFPASHTKLKHSEKLLTMQSMLAKLDD